MKSLFCLFSLWALHVCNFESNLYMLLALFKLRLRWALVHFLNVEYASTGYQFLFLLGPKTLSLLTILADASPCFADPSSAAGFDPNFGLYSTYSLDCPPSLPPSVCVRNSPHARSIFCCHIVTYWSPESMAGINYCVITSCTLKTRPLVVIGCVCVCVCVCVSAWVSASERACVRARVREWESVCVCVCVCESVCY